MNKFSLENNNFAIFPDWFVVVVVADVVVHDGCYCCCCCCNVSFKCLIQEEKRWKLYVILIIFSFQCSINPKAFLFEKKICFWDFPAKVFLFFFFVHTSTIFRFFFFIIYIFHNDAGREWVFRQFENFCWKINSKEKRKKKNKRNFEPNK